MRCSDCKFLAICHFAIAAGHCPKECLNKCPTLIMIDNWNRLKRLETRKMKIIDRRINDTEKTRTLEEIPFNQAFEFIDQRKPYHCNTFVKMSVCHTYRRGLQGSRNPNMTWAFDVRKGKLCQFDNNNEVRMLEAEFHIVREVQHG